MIRGVRIAVTLVVLLLQAAAVFAAEGRVVQVVNGDTLMLQVDGVRGPETIEARLRCSDAPILSSPFGHESKAFLEGIVAGAATIQYKLQAYCGSEQCIEVLASLPDPLNPDPPYINTQMIDAGMARNGACRGVFKEAEDRARTAKKGIWSTTQRITFSEPRQAAAPAPQPAPEKTPVITSEPQSAPATIDVNRAERTVTLKSRRLSLSKAVATIDQVSTVPVSLYLIEDQYIPIALDKVPWYVALQQVVETGNLKQVNMNGKIDLYDQLFYYKHIAPYLKLSDSRGVYISVGSGEKRAPAVDDGKTHYVFINDYENSAEVAKAQRESQHGYVQVNPGNTQEPAKNYGRFEVEGQASEPQLTAKAEPPPVPVVTTPPPLKPYSGERTPAPAVSQPEVAAPAATVPAVATAPESGEKGVDQSPAAAEQAPSTTKAASEATQSPAAEPQTSGKLYKFELETSELIALVVVFFIVVFGAIYLSRSAAARAAKAERSVDPAALMKNKAAPTAAPEPQVDKEYENEIFAELDHVADDSDADSAVDAIFGDAPAAQPADDKATAAAEAEPDMEIPEAEPAADVADAEPAAETEPEPVAAVSREPAPAGGKKKKKTAKAADSGNYHVTLDDYERLMQPPKREPRKDCLCEVTFRIDGQARTGIGLDISSGGMFIDSKDDIQSGRVLDLEFNLTEDGSDTIRCRGAVTWINVRPDPIKPNYPNGFGIRFLDLDAATEKQLQAYLAEQAGADAADADPEL